MPTRKKRVANADDIAEFTAIVARLYCKHKVGGYSAAIDLVEVPSIVIADVIDYEPHLMTISVDDALRGMKAAKAKFEANRSKPFVLSDDDEVINSDWPLTGSQDDDDEFWEYWSEEGLP